MGFSRIFELKDANFYNIGVGVRVTQFSWVTGLLFTFVVTCLVWALAPGCDPYKLGMWCLANLANVAMRVNVAYKWRAARAESGGADYTDFSRDLLEGAILSGLLWGLAAYLFFSDLNLAGKQCLLFCFLLISVKAVVALHSSLICYGAFACSMWVPMWFVSLHDPSNILVMTSSSLTVISSLYFCFMLKQAFHSMDETRNFEEEKARQMDRESAQRRLFFLAANHDLGQPLTTIQYELKKVKESTKDNGLIRPSVVNIEESVATLQRLIQDIIQYEKISSGIVSAERKVVSIHQVFSSVANQTSHLASVKDLGLWARPTSKQVLSDPFILERIVRNLVENALRYTKSGRVVMAARRRDGRTCIEVWDSGVGISPEDAEKIFDIHFRADATKDMHGGSGLGLSIVQRLAASIGAEICKPVSIPGRGTVFRLMFDRSSQVDDLYMPYKDNDVRTRPPSVTGLHVVLVDDDVALGNAIENDLRDAGAHPVFYQSSAEAQRGLSRSTTRVDVLLTDWNLVGETGGDVFRKIMQMERFKKSPPVWMVMSGDIQQRDANSLRGNGVVVLAKPFEPQVLTDHLSLLAAEIMQT